MCAYTCKSLFLACDECLEEAYQRDKIQREHKAILAHVPASDDEWHRRLDEVAPLEYPVTLSTQGNQNAQL